MHRRRDRIVFQSTDQATGTTSLHVVDVNGSGSTPLVTTSGADGTVFSMNLDGSGRVSYFRRASGARTNRTASPRPAD